jgi:hypothetical protein
MKYFDANYDKINLSLQMLQERFYGQELNLKILELIKENYNKGYNDGHQQGFVDYDPLFDKSLGGFHGDM